MVLDAERQLRRARTELVKARGDQQNRLAEIEKDGGRRLMKTHYVTVAVAVMLAVGAGYWAGQRKGMHESANSRRRQHGEFRRRTLPGLHGEAGGQKPRKLLYYRNPMGLPDTSPVPKKDSMGMDYIAVYEGEDDTAGRRRRSEDQHREGAEARRQDRGRRHARTDAPACAPPAASRSTNAACIR
jgi:hypothetical protein